MAMSSSSSGRRVPSPDRARALLDSEDARILCYYPVPHDMRSAILDSFPLDGTEAREISRYLATSDYEQPSSSGSGKKHHHKGQRKRAIDANASYCSSSCSSSSCRYFEHYAAYWERWCPQKPPIDEAMVKKIDEDLVKNDEALWNRAKTLWKQAEAAQQPRKYGKKERQQRQAKDDVAKKKRDAEKPTPAASPHGKRNRKIDQEERKKSGKEDGVSKPPKAKQVAPLELRDNDETMIEVGSPAPATSPHGKKNEKIDQEERKKSGKEDGVNKPPKSKQVAPLELRDVEEAMIEVKKSSSPPPPTSSSSSFGRRASDALGFVCEKLMRMWYPRLRRRS